MSTQPEPEHFFTSSSQSAVATFCAISTPTRKLQRLEEEIEETLDLVHSDCLLLLSGDRLTGTLVWPASVEILAPLAVMHQFFPVVPIEGQQVSPAP